MSEKSEPYLIPCTRPDLQFVIAPQDERLPKVTGKCGHDIYQRDQLMLGDLVISKPDKDRFGLRERLRGRSKLDCMLCEGKEALPHAIICASCGSPIFRGDPVSLYTNSASDNPFARYATKTSDGQATVNCMGWDCCPSGAFFAGHWNGDGILSPFATGSAVGDIFSGHATGAQIINIS